MWHWRLLPHVTQTSTSVYLLSLFLLSHRFHFIFSSFFLLIYFHTLSDLTFLLFSTFSNSSSSFFKINFFLPYYYSSFLFSHCSSVLFLFLFLIIFFFLSNDDVTQVLPFRDPGILNLNIIHALECWRSWSVKK